jgi:hypothetical protein
VFQILLLVLIAAAALHLWRSQERTLERGGLLLLMYVLVGYCGIPMIVVALLVLVHPGEAAEVLGFAAGNPFELFLGWGYLGMAVVATLSLRYRGSYLVAPALLWAIFFAGATAVHAGDYRAAGVLTHGSLLQLFVAHGLVSVLLVAGLWASGVWRPE